MRKWNRTLHKICLNHTFFRQSIKKKQSAIDTKAEVSKMPTHWLATASAWFKLSLKSLRIVVEKAGIAQLVEHNLAKVGVASSSLVSRSKIWWRVSKEVMHWIANPCSSVRFRDTPPINQFARVVKSVDTRDLKSLGFRAVAVQVRPRAPFKIICNSIR